MVQWLNLSAWHKRLFVSATLLCHVHRLISATVYETVHMYTIQHTFKHKFRMDGEKLCSKLLYSFTNNFTPFSLSLKHVPLKFTDLDGVGDRTVERKRKSINEK